MAVTSTTETPDTDVRVNWETFDKRCAALGAHTNEAKAKLIGLKERHLYRIRAGQTPTLGTAARMCSVLGVPFELLFEQKDAAA